MIRVWEEEMKNILGSSIENKYGPFEHSDVKLDTSAHFPNKKCVFLLMRFLKKNVQRVILLKEP